jgi:hypothetical protein
MVNFGINRKIESTKPKTASKPVSKPVFSGSKPLFDQKLKWHRKELIGKMINASHHVPGVSSSKGIYRRERKDFINKIFPQNKYGTHISKEHVRRKLKELRTDEYKAKSNFEKQEIRRTRNFLERETGFKGKY